MNPKRAFTVVELGVTMLIISIMAIIAVSVLNSPNDAAADSLTKTDIAATLDAAALFYEANGHLPTDASELPKELGLTLPVTDASADDLHVSVAFTESTVTAARRAPSGACWFAQLNVQTPTGELPFHVAVAPAGSSTACSANAWTPSDHTVLPAGNNGAGWETPQILP